MKVFDFIVHITDDLKLKKFFIKNFYRFFLSIVIPLLIMSYVFAFYMIRANEKQTVMMNETIIQRAADACDAMLKEIEFFVIYSSVDEDITEFILMGGEEKAKENVMKYLSFFKKINSYLESVYVYNIDTQELISNSSYTYNENFLDIMNIYPDELVNFKSTIIKSSMKNNYYPYIIQMARPIHIGNKQGVVVAEVNIHRFKEILSILKEHDENKILILNNDGMIIYSKNPTDDFMCNFQKYKNDNKGIYSQVKSSYYDLTYVSVMKNTVYTNMQMVYFIFIIFGFIVICTLGMALSYYLTKKTISPIAGIINAVKNKDSYEEDKNIPLEVQYIIDDILSSVEQNNDTDTVASKRIFMLKILNTQALEAQINPHFLYNTLDSINWTAFSELGKNNAISNSLNDLSKMFKFALSTNSYVITLKEEILHIKVYERLLNRRYGDNLKIYYNVSDECMSYHCVKFALQPIVENAVNHGLKPNAGVGNVYISAISDGEYWELAIKDDGVGIDTDRIEEMNKQFSENYDYDKEVENIFEFYQKKDMVVTEDSYPKQLGMKNVNKRIKLIYGNNCGIRIMRNEFGGTTVIIRQKNKL